MDGNLRPSEFVQQLAVSANVKHLSDAQAKELAEPYGQRTEFGNLNFISQVRSRSAWLTVYIGSEKVRQRKLGDQQKRILANVDDTLRKVHRYIARTPMVCLERTMGENNSFCPHCTMYVSVRNPASVRIPFMWGSTLFPYRPQAPGPDLTLIFVPEWPEIDRQILVFPEENVTYVLGSDYMGEAKKGCLRMAMYNAKLQGMLGLHAGAKLVYARDREDKLRCYGMLLFGLSATGKTTHSCHDHGLHGRGESALVIQDDVVFLCKDGQALGTERGFYLKTEGLDEVTQPVLYRAASSPDTIFENVMVAPDGQIDFQDETLTSNGRGVVQKSDFGSRAAEGINMPPLDELDGLILIFITRRNTILPMISKLTPAQAALAFMLGESVESSAGDPRRAGESVRVVGTNPFIVGDEAEEGNWIYDFVSNHADKIQAYLLNTGGVGEIMETLPDGTRRVKRSVLRIQIPETSAIFRAIVRDRIEWVPEPRFGTLVPKEVEGVDLDKFNPLSYYSESEVEEMAEKLKRERREYIEQFSGLHPDIVKACDV